MHASLIVALLDIATVWGFYLLPSLMGDRRDAPLSSTEQFDRWTSPLPAAQRREYNAAGGPQRLAVRARRGRVLSVLGGLGVLSLGIAGWRDAGTWLLVHLVVDV